MAVEFHELKTTQWTRPRLIVEQNDEDARVYLV